jgi:hypothetical protein
VNDTAKSNKSGKTKIVILLPRFVKFSKWDWKNLGLVAIIGAVLGFGVWFFLGSYWAEQELKNNNNIVKNDIFIDADSAPKRNISTETIMGIDLLTWHQLQKRLPEIASEIVNKNNLTEDQRPIYREMSDLQWWSKNVTISYSLSRAEAKSLGSSNKEFDALNNKIYSFKIRANGESQRSALNNALIASQFLRSGSAYLEVKALITLYQNQALDMPIKIQSQLNLNENDQNYLKLRITELEALKKRYPDISYQGIPLFKSNDSGRRFLPIESQMIAVSEELNQYKEISNRLTSRLLQIQILTKFLQLAIPKIELERDGIVLVKSLLAIEQDLRKELPPNGLNRDIVLDRILIDLQTIESRYLVGLEEKNPKEIKKENLLKSIVIGTSLAIFLMLVFLLSRNFLDYSKDRITTSITH